MDTEDEPEYDKAVDRRYIGKVVIISMIGLILSSVFLVDSVLKPVITNVRVIKFIFHGSNGSGKGGHSYSSHFYALGVTTDRGNLPLPSDLFDVAQLGDTITKVQTPILHSVISLCHHGIVYDNYGVYFCYKIPLIILFLLSAICLIRRKHITTIFGRLILIIIISILIAGLYCSSIFISN